MSASATTILHSRQVRYKNDKSVEQAINELYEKADECYGYHVGDEIQVNGVDFYVIADSPATQDYVVALKKEPLTVAELRNYGITSENFNGYGGISYGSTTGNYSDSYAKTVVEQWMNDKFQDELKEIDGYSSRLVKRSEYLSLNNYSWRYSSKYYYWTMDNMTGTAIWTVYNDGSLQTPQASVNIGSIRPVINVKKSSISSFDFYDNYYAINYLESTGTQYIDADYIPTNGEYIADMKIQFKNSLKSNGIIGYNYDDSGVRRRSALSHNASGYLIFGYGDGTTSYTSINPTPFTLNNDYYIFLEMLLGNNKSVLKISTDGENYTQIATAGPSTRYNPISISIMGTSLNSSYFSGRLYYAKIYNSTRNLVRDYIPVLDANDRPCLFDKVSKTCFYNQGTGEFLYG